MIKLFTSLATSFIFIGCVCSNYEYNDEGPVMDYDYDDQDYDDQIDVVEGDDNDDGDDDGDEYGDDDCDDDAADHDMKLGQERARVQIKSCQFLDLTALGFICNTGKKIKYYKVLLSLI